MEKNISRGLRDTFFLHFIIAGVLGLALWLIPGRTLILVGWVREAVLLPKSEVAISGGTFVDGSISRLLGAALLALAFSSYRGWRATDWHTVEPLVQLEAVFCVLGTIAMAYAVFAFETSLPVFGWTILVFLGLFSLAWVLALWR